jgi:hypothetical protein
VAQAKKLYWEKLCSKEVTESKDLHKVWKKLKELKNGYTVQQFPVKLENNNFPSNEDKAEAFVNVFSENSLSSSLGLNNQNQRKKEEEKEEYNKPINMNNEMYINADITIEEFKDALNSFKNNTSAVGLDGISYQLLCHLPLKWMELLHSFFPLLLE